MIRSRRRLIWRLPDWIRRSAASPLSAPMNTKLRAGQVIQSSLKENLGIDVELESMDLATYLDVTMTGDYEAAIGGYTSSSLLA